MSDQTDFFNKIKEGAIKGGETYKVLPSISLAQAALESDWGKSEVATKGNNLFGIKSGSGWTGKTIAAKTAEYVNGKWIQLDADFRKYESWADSVADHGEFFTSTDWRKTNYKAVIGKTDYKKAAKALQSAGYATDPTYADKLIKLIEDYKLNQWDNLKEETNNMTKILVIAGHGENKNGSFDPGATGIITKGEHKYYEQDFFPAVKKFLPANSNVVLYSEHNVYDYKDLVTIAKKYGNDTVVVEMHYDAGVAAASGGHVIVHKNYAPDNLDLKIRDVIKKHIGVRYTHKNEAGISGRDNLYNCNVAANNGINYRLVELGFGTSANDATKMVKNVESIAKDFVEALIGSSNNVATENKDTPVVKPQQPTTSAKSIDQLAKEVIQGEYGSGEDRKKALDSQYNAVQARVNELLAGNKTVPTSKSIDTLVKETLAGVHGNGDARKKSLGSNYDAVMKVINGGTTSKTTTVAKKKRIYLPKSAKTWRVYKTSGPYTTGKEVGFLAPAQYGGLDYEILRTIATDVYEIKTSAFGNVAIYAAKSTGAIIK